MLRGFFEWWGGLSMGVRLGVALAFLLLSGVFLLNGYVWILGWVIGGVLLVFTFLLGSD